MQYNIDREMLIFCTNWTVPAQAIRRPILLKLVIFEFPGVLKS